MRTTSAQHGTTGDQMVDSMQRYPSADGVVVPLRPADAAYAVVPRQRQGAAGVDGDLAALLASLERPDRFFAGVGNALWMSAVLLAALVSLVSLLIDLPGVG